jgi:protein TonB
MIGTNFEVGTMGMLITMGISMVLIVVFIYGIKAWLNHEKHLDLKNIHKGRDWESPLVARVKYPEVDAFRFSGPILNFGIAAALAFSILAFNWTQYEEEVFIPDDALMLDEEIEIEPPRTAEPPPPPPPPPPPVIEEVPDEEIIEEEEPVFMDQSVEEETVIEDIPEPVVEEAPPPPPPPPPPEPEVEEIFKVVEQMPRFPGCENENSEANRQACAQKKMLEYVYKNIKYPAIARENGIQGRVVIQFVVEKDGSVTDARVVRDIGAGCGAEGLRVVNSMNNMPQKWTPGKQRGKPVRVQFTLPVSFKLE